MMDAQPTTTDDRKNREPFCSYCKGPWDDAHKKDWRHPVSTVTNQDYENQMYGNFLEAWSALNDEQRFAILRYFDIPCEMCKANRDEIRYDHTTDDHANYEPGGP